MEDAATRMIDAAERLVAERGLAALTVPEDNGGMGLGAVDAMVVMEELGRGIVLEPLTQTLIVHMIRTPRIPFVQSRASWPLLAATAAIMAIGIFLPMGPLAGHFKLQTLPLGYFPWLIVILLAYAVLTTLLKRVYIRKYGW